MKAVIQSKIDDLDLELRSLMNDVKDSSKDINVEEIKAKKAELEEKRSALVKQLAECDRPEEPKEEGNFRKLANAMVEKRSVTLAGTGVINTVKELAKVIVKNTNVLQGARFFYGKDASTKIPVWGSQLTASFIAEGGSADAAQNTLSVTSLDAQTAISSLPVASTVLELGAANLEAELPGLFSGAFADLLADGMINGKSVSTTTCMVGLFGASNNTTAYVKAANLTNLAALARTLKAKTYQNPVIIMSPTVYAMFVADATSGEDIKIYKESLIRDKMIEGVPLMLTAYAPSTGSGASGAWADNDVIAVGGDLSNYAIGMAGQIDIKAKDTAGSAITTFDATVYLAGKPIIASDFYQYKIDV